MYVWHCVAQFQTMAIYLCAGKDPSIVRQHFPKAYGVMETLSIILHVFIHLKIVRHKMKSNQNNINGYLNNVVQPDQSSLFNYAIHVFTILFLSTILVTIKKIESMSMEELHTYPNFVAIFYVNLLAASLLTSVIAISFLKDKNLRQDITKEVLDQIQFRF